jgi:arylsulfatase
MASDFDGYFGTIPNSSATLAKVLGYYGYSTSAFGKWHNTPANQTTAMGPFDRWPTGLGFDYFYGFIAGETSQYEPRLFENTNPIEPEHSADYHLTTDMTDKAIKWMRQQRTYAPDKPFFLYWTPGATHGPHHVHKKWIKKYEGKFDEGWDAYRKATFDKQKASGWIPKDAEFTARPETMRAWNSLSDREKKFQARLMEVYAGFLEHTDTEANRLIDELEHLGIRDNTLIFYVLADNGASAEGLRGTIAELLSLNSLADVVSVEEQMDILDKEYGGLESLGGPLLDNMYSAEWAWAGNSPFKYTKLVASHFGGTRTPLVISWPKSIKPDKKPRSQFHHVNDIVPTIYDILDITPPEYVDGHPQDRIDGISMTYTFNNPKSETKKRVQYFENMGSRGVYFDGWFACTFGPRTPWLSRLEGIDKWNPDEDKWELYNLEEDFTQANDLADKYPEKLARMKEIFAVEAAKNNVFPIGGGLFTALYPDQQVSTGQTEWHFFGGMTRTPEFTAPKIGQRNNTVVVDLELEKNASGVLYALGGMSGGVTLYMDNGELVYEYNSLSVKRTKIRSGKKIATGHVKIKVQTIFTSKKIGDPADVILSVNGKEVTKGTVGLTIPSAFTASETFDVGIDLGSPVSYDYYEKAPFKFEAGTINEVYITY